MARSDRLLVLIIGIVLGLVLIGIWYSSVRRPSVQAEAQKTKRVSVEQQVRPTPEVEPAQPPPISGSMQAPQSKLMVQDKEPPEKTLEQLLTEMSSKWKLNMNNRAGIDARLALNLEELTAAEALKNMAKQLDLALVGDVKGVEDGSCKDINLTPMAIYAGSNPEVIELLESLGDSSAEVRADAVDELAELEEENIEPVIVHMLAHDNDEEVRVAAAAGLEETTSVDTIDVLVRALSDPSEEVREHARATLGLIGGPIVRDKLKLERARTESPEVRDLIDQILEQVLGEPLSLEED